MTLERNLLSNGANHDLAQNNSEKKHYKIRIVSLERSNGELWLIYQERKSFINSYESNSRINHRIAIKIVYIFHAQDILISMTMS